MMNPVVIDVENLGKSYRLGSHFQLDVTLPEMISLKAKQCFNRLRGIKPQPKTDDRHFNALEDVSFKVTQGEVVGIIGHNGAGKSTLLKILSEITDPSSGQAKIRGRVASLLEVGTGFHPELTGRENIYLNGSILGMTRKEIAAKFDDIVTYSGIEKFIDTPVKRYSSGMSVRLAFSIAAHLEPEILVIDEVLAVGDVEFQNRCLGRIQEVANSHRTVLFVSHNMAAVQTLCKRVIMLDHGKIVADGKPEDVIPLYINAGQLQSEDLATRTDRNGNGQAKITGCSITNLEGNQVQLGKPWQINVEYETIHPGDRHEFDFTISSANSPRVCYLSTNMLIDGPQHWPAKGTIAIRPTDPCPFWPQNYTMSTTLKHNGSICDQMNEAVQFSVILGEQNKYNSLGRRASVMVLDADVRVDESQNSLAENQFTADTTFQNRAA